MHGVAPIENPMIPRHPMTQTGFIAGLDLEEYTQSLGRLGS
jgi:hypothetical protein